MAERPLPAPAAPPEGAASPGSDRLRRLLRPAIVLPVLGAVVLLTILLTPQASVGRGGDQRLTTRSAEPQGARGLYETLQRLGWRGERRDDAFDEPLDSAAVYAVLDPPLPPSALEVHHLLDAVRAGASLLVIPPRGGALSDSLRVRPSFRGGPMTVDTGAVRQACHGISSGGLLEWPGGRPWMLSLVRRGPLPPGGDTAFVWVTGTRSRRDSTDGDTTGDGGRIRIRSGSGPSPSRLRPDSVPGPSPQAAARDSAAADSAAADDEDDEAFDVAADADSGVTLAPDSAAERMPAYGEPAASGWRLGRGRIVALADPDLLRNDVVRVCHWNAGLTAVRMVEWLGRRDDGGVLPRRIVFDEYHQGYGRHASVIGASRWFLAHTVPGRVLLQLIVAALVLLLASAPRPIAPLSRVTFERRSPLEHVGALSRAYEQIGATRLAARRLVRGVRRRHAHGAWRRASDEEFLQSIATRHPALAPDVRLLLDATRRPLPPAEFLNVSRAIETIERTLLQ